SEGLLCDPLLLSSSHTLPCYLSLMLSLSLSLSLSHTLYYDRNSARCVGTSLPLDCVPRWMRGEERHSLPHQHFPPPLRQVLCGGTRQTDGAGEIPGAGGNSSL